MIIPKTHPRKQARRGATLVETGIVLSAFLFLLFGLFEYGRLIMVRHLLDHAAREGARRAVVTTNTLTTADIQALVTARLAGQVNNPTVTVYKADPVSGANIGAWSDAGFGEAIAVRVETNYNWMLPNFWQLFGISQPGTLTSTSVMRSEAN